MCLITFQWQPDHPNWLTLSANRDEFYARPTRPMQAWHDVPSADVGANLELYAGKDLLQGGTWLGVTTTGHWAALTNVRALGADPADARSRGELVLNYLTSNDMPETWLASIAAQNYAPFNLLVGTRQQLWYLSNHPEIRCQPLSPGAYTLSNAQLNSPWPKAILALQQLNDWHSATPPVGLLNRRDPYPDEELPATGVPLEWERWLSAQFIHTPNYGTRCSTGIFTEGDRLEIAERTFDANGNATGTVEFTLLLSEDE